MFTEGCIKSPFVMTRKLKFNVQNSRMSPVLPFDVIALIIDTIGETKDKNLLKELSLVSDSFLQICRKHLFATVELHSANAASRLASSKKAFIKLIRSRPDVINYIRKLTYEVSYNDEDDH